MFHPNVVAEESGIVKFECSGLASDFSSLTTINIKVFDAIKKELVCERMLDKADVLSYGIHIHTVMLLVGDYTVQIEAKGKDYFLGKIKITSQSMLGNRVRDSLLAHGTPLIFAAHCDSRFYPYYDQKLIPWFDQPDAHEQLTAMKDSGKVTTKEYELLTSFLTNGYMLLENMIDDVWLDKINRDISDAINKEYKGYKYGSSDRIEHLHSHYQSIYDVWLNQSCKHYIDLIFQEVARPVQTLTFVFGSQQDPHQDTIHLTPFPAGYMCGLWIALQDVNSGSGELVVYPGSHREQKLRMSALDCAKVSGDWTEFGNKVCSKWQEMTPKYEPMIYRPKKGTALIWHENLLHGGSPRENKELERRSIVIHYFADGAVSYYDSTGLPGMAAPMRNTKR